MADKIKVSICSGTACFVMGASEILLLEDELPAHLKNRVEIEGITCMEFCKNPECGKTPFVKINDEVLPEATLMSVISKIEEIAGACQ